MKYISIGQFSKLSGLSIRALRLYDAEQLLEPNWVDPSTGYRYYTQEQADRAKLIRQLRACEMPLDQIQIVLSEPNQADLTLMRHRQYLEKRQLEHQEMLRTLDTLLPKPGDFDVKLRYTSAQPVLRIRERRVWMDRRSPGIMGQTMGEIYDQLQTAGLSPASAPLLTYACPDGTRELEVNCCVPINGHIEVRGRVERAELPAAELAYTTHRGSYDSLDETLEHLLRWVMSRHLVVCGEAREIFLEHAASVSDPAKYRTELAIPVQRTHND